MKNKIIIAPSILSGDFGALGAEAQRIEKAGADQLHIDVMDGHFVPNLTLGPKAVAAINRSTSLFLDVHLMIYNPFDFIERFAEAGADRITFHFEATENVTEVIEYIRKCGIKVGLAFSPETSFELIPKYLPLCDLILLMTVQPGFGGQKFIPEVLEKVELVREISTKIKHPLDIQVDGGIDDVSGPQCIKAGANVLVSGTYLFKAQDMKAAIQQLRSG